MRFAPRRKSPPPAAARRRRRAADEGRVAEASRDATRPPPRVAPEARDRRQVSGARVLCRCSLELPKLDPFSAYRARREGFMVLNVRGGSLYLAHPFTPEGAERVFPPGRAVAVKDFTLWPDGGDPVALGRVGVRYLKTVEGHGLVGLVLRFVGLDERQMDLLNGLRERCPTVDGDEQAAVPKEALLRA